LLILWRKIAKTLFVLERVLLLLQGEIAVTIHPLGQMLLFLGRGALIRTRLRHLAGWCCMDGVGRSLHPDVTEVLDSPWKLSEARRRRDGVENERHERGENDAPEWSGWLHGMKIFVDGSNLNGFI
jgi:hypothetical protein